MSMFSSAPTLKTAASSSKADVATVQLAGVERLAALDYLIKSLTSLKAEAEADVKGQMATMFVDGGCKAGKRLENFKAVEGLATVSCQLKDRSSASPVSAEEESLLVKFGIQVETKTATCETFVINPAYCEDAALLGKVEKAMSKVVGLPADFFMKQEGKSTRVVSKGALETVFKTLKPDVAKMLLPVVGTLACGPKFGDETTTPAQAYEVVKDMIALAPPVVEEAKPAKGKAKKAA